VRVKKSVTRVLVALMVLVLVMPMSCAKPRFELSSLEITPNKVAAGDMVTITVDLANVGTAEGTYTATLSVDSVVIETKDVNIPEGATRKLTFSMVEDVVGIYTVEVGDLSGTLQVVKPAEFRLSSLEVTPTRIEQGEQFTVTVDVNNIGKVAGIYTVVLNVNGVRTDTKTVTITAGATKTVSFEVVKEIADTYDIELGGLTATVTVSEYPYSGWTVLNAKKFKIALPEDWVKVDIMAETIDAMIEEMGITNPDVVPYLEVVKNQEYIKFWAYDMASPPTFVANILGGYEIRLIRSLDEYVEILKEMYESLGMTVSLGDRFSLKGDEALIMETRGTYYYPSGESYQSEMQILLVDHAGYRYLIGLAYSPEYAKEYKELFDLIVQTFRVVD